jgi:pSer/pThr/pTyr-binding forkhead associated (FHA) protein
VIMPGLRHSTPQGDKTLPLRETFTIGRDAQNDLALPDDSKVSHQHACIRHVGDTYVLEDLQSTNGTFLEREFEVTRITSPQQLRPNDVIRVGSTRLVFTEGVAAHTPPVTPSASEPDARPLAPTEMLGETRVGRWLPEFLEPPEGFAPSPQPASPTPQEAAQRIAELEQQLAELKAQLAKKQGEG